MFGKELVFGNGHVLVMGMFLVMGCGGKYFESLDSHDTSFIIVDIFDHQKFWN